MPRHITEVLSPLNTLPEPVGDFTFRARDVSSAITDQEAAIATWLSQRLFDRRQELLLSGLYYEGMQAVTSLGIMIPPELEWLRAVIGWAQIGVDALDQRLNVHGFRLPSSTDTDADIWDLWQANNLVEESGLAHLDALIYGTSYVVVGAREGGGQPVITIESPLDMFASWDPRRRVATAALQTYNDVDPVSEFYGKQRAALYLIGATIHLVRTDKGWTVIDRDDHGLNELPVVPIANRERTGQRVGNSEITLAWRNTIDRACRNLVGMEVNREFNGAPPRYILGAAQEAFENSDGSVQSAWETYIGRILMLPGYEDDEGTRTLPQVGTFDVGSPEAFTKLHEMDIQAMASLMGVPPQYLGLRYDGNPASADAIRLADFQLKTKADKKCVVFGSRWEQVIRLGLLIRDGSLPADAHRLETDWAFTGIPTPAGDTDAIVKQIQAGLIAADSDVARERIGYSPNDRTRIGDELRRERGRKELTARIGAATQRTNLAVGPQQGEAA